MPLYGLSIPIYDELGEVPFDKAAQSASLLVLEILPKGLGLISVHVSLLEDVTELCLGGEEVADYVFAASWLLAIELVAGESQDLETCKTFQMSLIF